MQALFLYFFFFFCFVCVCSCQWPMVNIWKPIHNHFLSFNIFIPGYTNGVLWYHVGCPFVRPSVHPCICLSVVRSLDNIPTFHALSFYMPLPTHIIHEGKLHFIAYKSVNLFSMGSVYIQSFEHLNKVGVKATMDSELENQRAVMKFLLLEGEKPCHIFQRLQKRFSKACISCSTFYSWVSQFREGRTSEGQA